MRSTLGQCQPCHGMTSLSLESILGGTGVSVISEIVRVFRGLLTITQKLIESMPAEEPGSAKQSTTALQLLKAARDEEVGLYPSVCLYATSACCQVCKATSGLQPMLCNCGTG